MNVKYIILEHFGYIALNYKKSVITKVNRDVQSWYIQRLN